MKTEIFLEQGMKLIAQYDELVSIEIGTIVSKDKKHYCINGKVFMLDKKLMVYMVSPI